jgi:dihydroorotate dehydrogenase
MHRGEVAVTLYIAPPASHYVRPRGAVPVLGSYTLHRRPGRFGQVLRTVRPVPGGWVNAIGLRNPGVAALRYRPDVVCSLAAVDDGDWERLFEFFQSPQHVMRWPTYRFELNFSCPNVEERGPPTDTILSNFRYAGHISVKLPPDIARAEPLVERALAAGIRLIHLSNTLPSPIGGISGAALFRVNLPIVAYFARKYPEAEIIAGGGIRGRAEVAAYRDAGARHLSVSTALFNPLRAAKLLIKGGASV